MKTLDDTNLGYLISKIKAAFWPKTDVVQVSIDTTPTENSTNLVGSGGVYSALAGKQNALTFDSTPTANSTNPVTSGGVKAYVDGAIPTVPSDLDDLSDVNLGTPSDGDVLTYDSTTQKWVADEPQGGELSTDVVTDRTDNTKASTPKSVYDFVKPEVKSTRPAGGMVAGITYRLGALSGSVSITFAAPTDNTVVNLYHFTFTTGSTVPQITWPNTITRWAGNCIDASSHIPSLVANGYYEVMFDYASGAGVCNKFEAV